MCDDCEWETALGEIEDMLSSGEYAWAGSTLTGIYEWVEKNEHITDGQETAIENIGNRGR